jgi:pimeloyl-ACP methyl ester carboxylesterase
MGVTSTIARLFGRNRTPILNSASDVGDGPVIILIHGLASSAATFEKVIPDLSERYRCVSIELLGFGESPTPAGALYTLEEHVASIAATIKSLRLDAPFILVGHSLGGLLCARYAAQNPAQVSRLVLVSPPIYIAPSAIGDPAVRGRVGRYLKLYEFMRENKDLTMATATAISRFLQLGTALEVTERNWNPFILSLQNCIESQTTVADVAAVRVPIDVVYGGLDEFIAPGTLSIIEQMRHVTMHRDSRSNHLLRGGLARTLVSVIG